jgi:hypothetical protein
MFKTNYTEEINLKLWKSVLLTSNSLITGTGGQPVVGGHVCADHPGS